VLLAGTTGGWAEAWCAGAAGTTAGPDDGRGGDKNLDGS
jgi:hypothetical protein